MLKIQLMCVLVYTIIHQLKQFINYKLKNSHIQIDYIFENVPLNIDYEYENLYLIKFPVYKIPLLNKCADNVILLDTFILSFSVMIDEFDASVNLFSNEKNKIYLNNIKIIRGPNLDEETIINEVNDVKELSEIILNYIVTHYLYNN